LTKEELTRHLLALVLTAVLVWNTVLIPASASAPTKRVRRRTPGGEARGAESRRGGASAGTSRIACDSTEQIAGDSVDDLDWPEFIGLE
jgi:hypothetical protein